MARLITLYDGQSTYPYSPEQLSGTEVRATYALTADTQDWLSALQTRITSWDVRVRATVKAESEDLEEDSLEGEPRYHRKASGTLDQTFTCPSLYSPGHGPMVDGSPLIIPSPPYPNDERTFACEQRVRTPAAGWPNYNADAPFNYPMVANYNFKGYSASSYDWTATRLDPSDDDEEGDDHADLSGNAPFYLFVSFCIPGVYNGETYDGDEFPCLRDENAKLLVPMLVRCVVFSNEGDGYPGGVFAGVGNVFASELDDFRLGTPFRADFTDGGHYPINGAFSLQVPSVGDRVERLDSNLYGELSNTSGSPGTQTMEFHIDIDVRPTPGCCLPYAEVGKPETAIWDPATAINLQSPLI